MQVTKYTDINPRLDSIMNGMLHRQMDEINAEALRIHGAENLELAKRIQAERNAAKENEPPNKNRLSTMSKLYSLITLFAIVMFIAGCSHKPVSPESVDEHGHDHSGHNHSNDEHDGHGEDEHGNGDSGTDEHNHSHNGMTTVEISDDGQNNIGMRTVQTSLSDFQRTISVTGRIVGQPEHWRMAVAAPVNGVVSEINVTAGESVDSGKLLCKLRVTDDELITRQTSLLEQVGQLEFIRRDEERLRTAVDAGGAAAKSLVERQYELRRLEISIAAVREGLGLVGLNNEQIESIIKERKLIGTMPVTAPAHHADEVCDDSPHTLTVSQVNIVPGQRVMKGEALLTLGDYCKLQIEAYASESETPYIYRVLNENLAIAAILNPVGTSERNEKEQRLDGLKLLYIAPELDPQTRSLRLVINLDNESVHESEVGGRKFTTWRYRPGERLEVLLPLEVWTKRIVLPAEAVIQDGAESVVFVKENDTFIRHPVVEEYRDTNSVVLKEETLPVGEYVVTQGAFRVHLAMQNASGAPIDPHAGHSH